MPDSGDQSQSTNLQKDLATWTNETNQAENEVSKQVLLVASATLAILGSVISDTRVLGVVLALVTIAVISLTVSIVSGVVQFCVTFSFWQKGTIQITSVQKYLQTEDNLNKRQGAIELTAQDLNGKGSNQLFFWTQISSFLLSVVILAMVILINLHYDT